MPLQAGNHGARAADVTVIDAIEYAAPFGFRPLLLDLYLPQSPPGPVPVVVFIHGGGWAKGTRKRTCPPIDALRPFQRFTEAGLAVAAVDYRLSGEALFPAQLHDVKAAVCWLRSNAVTYGLDPDRIVAWGESAGGHLAALLGLTGDDPPELRGPLCAAGVPSAVCGVIDWFGPADLVSLADVDAGPGGMEHNSPRSPEGGLLGGVVKELLDAARSASPLTYAHAGAPPFHIKHGTADKAVPPEQSERLAAALDAVGVPVELDRVEGADHIWINAAEPEAILATTIEFACKVAQ